MTDTKKLISTLEMPDKITLFKELYNELAGYGIDGDTELAHVNTFEARWLKSMGGSGSINDITGLREYKGGGSPPPPAPSTVTQTSEFPTELRPFIKDILGEAKGEFAREKEEGYVPFGGPQLAQFTPEQQQAFATGREQFGAQGLAGTPLAQASTYYQPALAATALGTSEVGTGDIQRRMDPFLQNVVDVAKREARRDEDIAAQGRAAQAVGAGSFGGSRQAILEAEAERNLGQRLGDIQAAGLSQAFQNAQRAAEAQRARELSGGRQFAGLGESAFQRARGDITGLAGIGEAQQGRSQQALDLARREFEEEKAFPSTALQRYSSLIRGWGLMPTQTTVSTPAPPIRPGLAQQLAGAAGTGIGLYGAFGGFGKPSVAATGGLVGLMGGGTPTTPLRPPYELFPDRLNRQYNTGGMIGLGIGGRASGVAHPIPNQPVPSGGGKAGGKGMFQNLIVDLLRKQYNLGGQTEELGQTKEPFNVNLGRFANTGTQYHPGAATGGLLGLTVSQNARRGAIVPTDIIRLGAEVNPEVLEGREFMNENLSPSGAITAENRAALDALARERIQKSIEAIQGVETGLPIGADGGLSTLSDRDQQIIAEDALGEYSSIGLNPPTVREEIEKAAEEQEKAKRLKEQVEAIGGPEEESVSDEVTELSSAAPDASTAPVAPTDPADPADRPLTYLEQLQKLMAEQSASSSKALSDAAAAEGKYLKYLQDQQTSGPNWNIIGDYLRRIGSETPRYEGEDIFSIASRAGEEPFVALQEAQATDKALGFKIAEAEKDMAVRRAALETASLQQSFDNRIKLMEAQSKTGTQFLDLYREAGNIDKGDITLSGNILGSELKRISGIQDPKRLQTIIDGMGIDGLTPENFDKFVTHLTKRQKDPNTNTTRHNDYVGHIAALAKKINADKIAADGKGDITQANLEAIMQFIRENKMFQEPGWFKDAVLSN